MKHYTWILVPHIVSHTKETGQKIIKFSNQLQLIFSDKGKKVVVSKGAIKIKLSKITKLLFIMCIMCLDWQNICYQSDKLQQMNLQFSFAKIKQFCNFKMVTHPFRWYVLEINICIQSIIKQHMHYLHLCKQRTNQFTQLHIYDIVFFVTSIFQHFNNVNN